MSLDWKHFEEILTGNQSNRKAHLETIVNETEFIIHFLRQLAHELKHLKTGVDCVHKFPDAGSILTLASKHPFLNYTPSIAKALLLCFIEYSKLNLDSSVDRKNKIEHKSTLWCLNRLRRVSSHVMADIQGSHYKSGHMDKAIHDILLLIKNIKLDAQKVTLMTDYCIALAPEEKASRVIEKLVDHALPIPNTEDPAHFDSPQALLSDKFLFHLMHPSDSSSMTLHHHYRQWSTDLKIKLLNHYDDILEMEVLTLIEVYVQQGKYMHLDDLNKKIRHHALIPVLSSPVLKERALFHLASSVELFHHWELIRLNTCFQDILRSRLYERCHAIILYHSDCISACARELFDVMRSYIFSGSIEGISTRKYHVWTFTLSLNRYIWQCTHTLMVWCNGNDPWVSPMEDVLNFINFIIYPSMDQRQYRSLSDIREWLISCQGNNMIHKLYLIWRDLFNHNATIMSSFTTNIILKEYTAYTDQIAWIDKAFFNLDLLPSHQRSLDMGVIHILLDYLYDIKHHHQHYSACRTNIDSIIHHVYTQAGIK